MNIVFSVWYVALDLVNVFFSITTGKEETNNFIHLEEIIVHIYSLPSGDVKSPALCHV